MDDITGGITWTCHVCGEERPDEFISVFTIDRSEEKGLPRGTMQENVRYCNDRIECAGAAPFGLAYLAHARALKRLSHCRRHPFGLYLLVDGVPAVEPDLQRWAQWYEENKQACIVQQTKVGSATVSTVFLAITMNFSLRATEPELYETMVFGGPIDQCRERYATVDEARRGHEAMIKRVETARAQNN